jgi:hypothetical protein
MSSEEQLDDIRIRLVRIEALLLELLKRLPVLGSFADTEPPKVRKL